MKEPKNEMETILLFERMLYPKFEILSLTPSGFPDAVVLEMSSQKQYRVEFEFMASSFIQHEHDPRKCDVIACWKNDLDKSIRFPVWEISTHTLKTVFTPTDVELENFVLKIENTMLKREQRRAAGLFAVHWKTAQKELSDDDMEFLKSAKTEEICFRWGINDRTARNWRKNAQAGK
jgi:hypothetical protein